MPQAQAVFSIRVTANLQHPSNTSESEKVGLQQAWHFGACFHQCCHGSLSTDWLTVVQSGTSPSSNYPPSRLFELATPLEGATSLADPGSAGLDLSLVRGIIRCEPHKAADSTTIRPSSVMVEALSATVDVSGRRSSCARQRRAGTGERRGAHVHGNSGPIPDARACLRWGDGGDKTIPTE